MKIENNEFKYIKVIENLWLEEMVNGERYSGLNDEKIIIFFLKIVIKIFFSCIEKNMFIC